MSKRLFRAGDVVEVKSEGICLLLYHSSGDPYSWAVAKFYPDKGWEWAVAWIPTSSMKVFRVSDSVTLEMAYKIIEEEEDEEDNDTI